MSSAGLGLFLSVFLASAVEAVEAFTIVLAVGHSRDWRSALLGAGAGALSLAALVATLGPALARVPIDPLRLAVGAFLLAFGLRWLRKAVLRAAGLLPLRDEEAVFAREEQAARRAPRGGGLDGYALTIAFKAVLLEGLEVVLIVLGFGAGQGRVGLAALAALAAATLVLAAGIAARAPLSRVPENAMKFAVGVLLTSFGAFWVVEGLGGKWPGGEIAVLALLALTAALSLLAVARLGRAARAAPFPRSEG